MDWSEKIKCIENELGISDDRGRLARLINVRPGIISDIKTGKSKKPSADIPLLLITMLGVNPEWLNEEKPPILTDLNWLKSRYYAQDLPLNKLSKQLNDVKSLHKEAEKTAFSKLPDTSSSYLQETNPKETLVVIDGGIEQGVLVPVINQGLSAGFGFDYDEGEIIRYIKVPAWIPRRSRDLLALPIHGDSMEPTISNGDLVVCGSGGFQGDGLYMLRDQDRGLMFCKRVLWVPGGWTIKSDNPTYEPMKVDDKAIEVIARVIAAIKEVK